MAKDTKAVEMPAQLRPVVRAAAKNLLAHLYGPEGPPWGTSFAELEELAVQISRALGAEVLQQALQRQADQTPPPALSTRPTCAGPLDERPPEPRSVRTDTGNADWHEPARFCPRCRRAFSPSEQESGH